MTLRLIADREPYTSYAQSAGEGAGYYLDICPPEAPARPSPIDLQILPANLYLSLDQALRRSPSFAYGPTALMQASFAAGCLDYLREPWDLTELFARASRIRLLKAGDGAYALQLRDSRLTVIAPSQAELVLTEPERRLLRLLLLNAGLPVPRRALSFALWGEERDRSRAVDVHISALRRRLEAAAPGLGARIRASRHFGYRLLMQACA